MSIFTRVMASFALAIPLCTCSSTRFLVPATRAGLRILFGYGRGGRRITDLMPLDCLDVGKGYAKVEETDKGRKLYGLIPLMASCSYGQIGALCSESFNERILRCAGHVLTEGNTLLDDAELEMLVVLRMNRDFIEFMREHYGHLIKEQFGKTVVKEEMQMEE